MGDEGREFARDAALREEMRRRPRSMGEPQGVVPCRTVAVGVYPTAASRYYMVRPDAYAGNEVEGGTVTKTAVREPFPAANVGNAVPSVGTAVLVFRAGGRHVFDYST